MRPITYIILFVLSIGLAIFFVYSRAASSTSKEIVVPEPPKPSRFDWKTDEGSIYVVIDKERQVEYVICFVDRTGMILLDKHKLNAEKP